MRSLVASIFTFGVLLLAAAPARADLKVGTLTTTARVLREDAPPPTTAVHLYAARNETRSFQVLVRSDTPIAGLALQPGDLDGPVAQLRRTDAVLYRQHQLEATKGTYRNAAFKPGWYPDPLIPARHPVTGASLSEGNKPRFVAMPFDLPANQTHGFFVDIPVPKDAKPGDYRGAYRLTAPGQPDRAIPVTLTVWDFAHPDTPFLQTAFGSPAARMRSYYVQRAKAGKEPPEPAPTDWPAIETQCALLLSQHRISATPPALGPARQEGGSYAFTPDQVASLRAFLDRYHPNALSVSTPQNIVKDPVAELPKLRAFYRAFDQLAAALNRPEVVFYTYLKDEPNDPAAYAFVRKWGKAQRDLHTIVKVMVVEQPQTQDPAWGDLYGAVDIWCPLFSLFEEAPAAARRKLGESLWAYTALCQGKPTPWWHIDYPLLNYRVPAWIAWRYRITGLLYWGGMSYWNETADPWTDPWTYGHQDNHVFLGEGTLVYPARAVGYDGIVPSLRLKALRDGIQDYDYFALLDRAGRAAEAEKIVLPLASSWYDWNLDPAAYAAARAKLAELILSAKP